VYWEAHYRPVDPGTVYQQAASQDRGSIAS